MDHAADDHGVTELLRLVAERSSLNESERKEVSSIVERVEKKAGERKTTVGKLKKKMNENIEATPTLSKLKDNIDTINEKVHQNIETINEKVHEAVSKNKEAPLSDEASTTSDNDTTESVNKWGKDLLNKFSNPRQTPSKGGTAAGEYFKSFTLKGMQNPLKQQPNATANATATRAQSAENFKARQKKFVNAFERSSQSGRDFFKKASANFENSLQKLESSLDSFTVGSQASAQPEADYDVNSPEYKMDLKGIALLKEIFPEESTENLIKMHFEHVNASKNVR